MAVPPVRTLLFLPGNRAGWAEKAADSGADAMVMDLEGAVPPDQKLEARQITAEAIGRAHAEGGPQVFVRTTAATSGTMDEDLEAVVRPGLAGVLLPQVRGVDDVARLATVLDRLEPERGVAPGSVVIDPLLETPEALHASYELACSSPRIAYMGAGVSERGDIARRMRYEWTRSGLETLYFRSKVLLDVRAAGVPHPLSGIWGEIADLEGLRDFARQTRQIGYEGMMVIHPSHVPVVNEVFTPTAEEVAYWRELLATMEEAYAAGRGAVRFKGELIDEAHIETARQELAFAEELGVA